jgi:murein DD-endopeptidase MepM/ murein hydrolase activator NlpD
MQRSRVITRIVLPVLFVIGVLVVGFGLTFFAGTLGVLPQRNTRLVASPGAPVPLPGTPVARFEQVNPAVVNQLDRFQSGYRPAAADEFGIDVQPIGAYLPRTGNREFALRDPTPLPTPFPYPTSPPLPAPPIPGDFPPTLAAPDDRVVPFPRGQTDCAPGGLPAEGIFTQRYNRFHLAVDIGVRVGTPVQATHSGVVIYADWSEIGYGYLVILQSGPFITYYAHNASFNVEAGQLVGQGSIVAWSGSTGNSTGPHVHYETRINDLPVDPLTFNSRGYISC